MIEHLCPQCGKISYSADEHSFSPCPYCGCKFSGKYGSDRRREERTKKRTPCVLTYLGQYLEAESTDFSKEGFGMKILARTAVAADETIELSIDDRQIKAQIIWANKLGDKSLVGLRRITKVC